MMSSKAAEPRRYSQTKWIFLLDPERTGQNMHIDDPLPPVWHCSSVNITLNTSSVFCFYFRVEAKVTPTVRPS